MRLDRFVSHATGFSRSEAQRAIRAGTVKVSNLVVREGSTPVPPDACVELEGEPIALPRPAYLMMHKPAGYVCAREESRHPTVLDLIAPPAGRFQLRPALQIVGRLDLDTTGLLLLTTDGDWNHRITSPRGECAKTYEATLAAPLEQEALLQLQSGVMLRADEKPTRPSHVERLDETRVIITIHEGRYHQVKRMFAAVGNHVVSLHRSQIGSLRLDPALPPGSYRSLTPEEIHLF